MPTPHSNLSEHMIGSRSRFSGIDKAVIESLLFFRLSSHKGSKQGLECVVCLSEFEHTEVLRLLPKCRHAFHMNCIDNWLESHSSCPRCRYKFDKVELMNCTYTNSLRYTGNPSNPLEDPNLEFFVQRSSARFDLGSSFQKFEKPKKDLLVQEGDIQKLFYKFKHKITISEIVYKGSGVISNPQI
ncbi:putative RING-H2 finger protein ATL12 [Camellia lanceoleosa]|uniref:RING-H2 finger protein ATL12 n=1 Tax=Camellia lanceoleosa TaxID=1840588 RepID=A0ACC0FET5_9ERIC|nr:putative RING-H2 finger protein ATL12 [Camellia lanceoleosa]